jgi:hypothetical protein
VLEAFRSPSPDRAHHLFPNPVGVAEWCPDHPEVGERFVNQYLEARKSFKRCAKLDWAGVGDLRVQRTEEDKAVPGCGGRMLELDDMVAIVNTHDSTYKIEIDDPVSLPGLVLLSKDVSCQAINRDCREAMENVVDIRGMKSDGLTLDEEIIGRTLNCHSTWSGSSGRMLKLNVETIACLKEADNEDGLLNCEAVASKGPVFPPSCVRLFKIIDGCKSDNSEELGDGFANLPQIAKENWNDITDDGLLGAFCDQELATIRPVLGACPKTLKEETSPFPPLDANASKKEWTIKNVSARAVSDLEPIAARREEEANPKVEVTPENFDTVTNAASPTRDLTALARLRASSNLPDWNGHSYNIVNLTDGRLETSWQPKKKSGVGEWFALDIEEEFEFKALEIANGYQ